MTNEAKNHILEVKMALVKDIDAGTMTEAKVIAFSFIRVVDGFITLNGHRRWKQFKLPGNAEKFFPHNVSEVWLWCLYVQNGLEVEPISIMDGTRPIPISPL